MIVRKAFTLLTFASLALSAPALADSNYMALADIGRKDAILIDMNTVRTISVSIKQTWVYTLFATPQIDGNEYFLTMYQLGQYDCNNDQSRVIETHTYDLNDKETGTAFVNSSVAMQNIIPGSVGQEIKRIVCKGTSTSDTVLTNGLVSARRNYYQMMHDNKLQ